MVGRVFNPGVAVWVDLRLIFQADAGGPRGSGLALIVRSQGLVLDQTVPGELHAWLRTNRGVWLGLTSFVIESRALTTLRLHDLVRAQALRPREFPGNGS